MKKSITPIKFIVFVVVALGIAFGVYAEEPQERITNTLGLEFVLTAPAKFLMGSPEEEPGRYGGEIPHTVNLTHSFDIQTTEVTQSQWLAMMGGNPSSHQSCGGRCPVQQVSWQDAQHFIQKRNRKEGTDKYRLPNEAEWEYACRAGSKIALPNVKITALRCDLDDNLDALGWYCGNAQNLLHPAAGEKPNVWGRYDMPGNIQEWCQDWFGVYPIDEVINPRGPKKGFCRVMRGGAWYNPARDVRSASRFGSPPHYRFAYIGFRLCKTP